MIKVQDDQEKSKSAKTRVKKTITSKTKVASKKITPSTLRKKAQNTKAELEKKIKGYAADSKGLRFESNVIAYYDKRGWKCTPRVKKFGREFDIVGKKTDGIDTDILVVECKDKRRVTTSDVLSFMVKAKKYNDTVENEIQAVIAFTGELPKDAEAAATSAKPRIKFKHF